MGQFEMRARQFINDCIPAGELRDAVTPDFSYGCKRGLVSDDFYPALMRDNVELLAEGLTSVEDNAVNTSGGRNIAADVIIYCTGYRVLDFDRIDVRGIEGLSLADEMAKTPQAYKGIAASGFPNYFFAAGPNGLAINISYFGNVERNVKTIVNLLRLKQQQGYTAIAVKKLACEAYNQSLHDKFGKYSWASPGCSTYYQTESGHAPFLFPGTFKDYNKLHETTSLQDFEEAATNP
jgi:cation diffusion facilitator CzcD-associated flavoprotein CzcO